MRTLLMALLGVLLVGLPLLGQVGPIELMVWLVLAVLWVFALLKWAIPADRRAKERNLSGI